MTYVNHQRVNVFFLLKTIRRMPSREVYGAILTVVNFHRIFCLFCKFLPFFFFFAKCNKDKKDNKLKKAGFLYRFPKVSQEQL